MTSAYDFKSRFQALLRPLSDRTAETMLALQSRFSERARQGRCATWE